MTARTDALASLPMRSAQYAREIELQQERLAYSIEYLERITAMAYGVVIGVCALVLAVVQIVRWL